MVSKFLTRIPPLFSDLAKIIAGDIDCSHTTLTEHSTDGSHFTILPQAVIFPKTTTDIKHILGFAREYTMPISVWGKGSARTGGALSEGIIVDMTRHFNQIRHLNIMEHTVTVDAGTTVASLLEKLHGWHFDIPLFMGIDKETTIGAVLATKPSATGSFHHGTIREWVEGVTIVVDNGEEHTLRDGIMPSGRLLGIYQEIFPLLAKEAPILRAAKPGNHDNSTGYTLWNTSIGPRQLIDQLIGSEGTLAIITSVTLRVAPYKPHILTTCIPVEDKKLLATYIDIAKHHRAESIFLYDEMFMQLSERYHKNLVPYFNNTPYVLLVTHTSSDKEKVHHLAKSMQKVLHGYTFSWTTLEDRKRLETITDSRFLMSLFSSYANNTLIPISTANGLIVDHKNLLPFLEDVENYLDSLGKLYTITGNVGSAALAVNTLFDPSSKRYEADTFSYAKNIFSLVKEYNGGISASGGEGLVRTPFINYIYNEATLSVFKKIKDIWDPLTLLNPGKKLHSGNRYFQEHGLLR